ncbi:B3/4 domain [uncultured Eubacterium sp.]|nr:B3/4 domain [uncultured Eubacterium sp.]
MKKFIVEDGVFDIFPHLEIGIVTLHGADNSGQGREDLLKAACEEIALEGEVSPNVTEYKEAMKQIKKKKGAAASIDAMTKRILKGGTIGSINKVVDIYNFVSLKHLFTCGGENLDKIRGDMVLGFARGDEPFVPLGEEESAPPRQGELIYYDESGAIVRSWLWREAERTKITEEANNILLYMECINPQRHEAFSRAVRELSQIVTKNVGGEASVAFLSREQPEAVIEK